MEIYLFSVVVGSIQVIYNDSITQEHTKHWKIEIFELWNFSGAK